MPYLVETPMLLRLANASDPQYVVAEAAISRLRSRGESLHVAPQNLVEFRNGATRPTEANGLGLPPAVADQMVEGFERAFSLLPETPDIYPAWKALVQAAGVVGKQVHDARLVAICRVYGITHVLTFNVCHFARLATFVPGLVVVDPHTV